MPLPPQVTLRDYRVTAHRMIAEETFELTLSPSDAANRIPDPLAGQWVMLHLLEADGTVWAKAAYSIANAADEVIASGNIVLAIRVAGDFTQRAQRLAVGDLVRLQGPFGVFHLKPASHHYFFAGGIGITPMRSMILQSLAQEPSSSRTLFYSARTANETAYLEAFRALAASPSSLAFIPCFTRETDSTIAGERGRVTDVLTRRPVQIADDADCYVCGPRSFIDDVIRMLKEMGVDPKRIYMERF